MLNDKPNQTKTLSICFDILSPHVPGLKPDRTDRAGFLPHPGPLLTRAGPHVSVPAKSLPHIINPSSLFPARNDIASVFAGFAPSPFTPADSQPSSPSIPARIAADRPHRRPPRRAAPPIDSRVRSCRIGAPAPFPAVPRLGNGGCFSEHLSPVTDGGGGPAVRFAAGESPGRPRESERLGERWGRRVLFSGEIGARVSGEGHVQVAFLSAICNRESRVYLILDTMGIVPKPQHRCPIPLASNTNRVTIPSGRTPDKYVANLHYVVEDEQINNALKSPPLFGGHETWSQREESFKLNSTMKVHCGFIRNAGAEMDPVDIKYVKKCRFVVASGIFDGYDAPHQPSNISDRSKKLFCFLMVVDEESLAFIKNNVTVRKDDDRGQWVGIWRLVLLKNSPYDEPRRNGKVPKILTHRLFPQTQYSIWIDGKMELMVDPLLMLERYLWRGKHTFAIAQHKHHHSIYEEADANKRRKRYARPLIDLHMKIYKYEGMQSWTPEKGNPSDVPEGAIIIREHTAINNLFSCLWFNEVDLFTPRDQLSFGRTSMDYTLGTLHP
ncbi:hypothetical protein NL676_038345 [Syzygium grande]|nr:hypothetical protein NL676_038345 [Syzygium grande]